MRSLPPSLVLSVSVALVACSSDATTGTSASVAPPGSASNATGASAATTRDKVVKGSDDIKPVYPIDNSPPLPVAKRYCDAVQSLPNERKAACCEETPRVMFAGECTRTLSAAMRSNAVSAEEAAVAKCEEAMKKMHDGCGWVGLRPMPVAKECLGIFEGHLADGEVCRSSLECKKGLTCYGLSATSPGKCVTPRPKDAVCNTGTETLALMTLQGPSLDVEHPTCEGGCNRQRCVERPPVGGPCKMAVDCGHGQTCVDDKCSDKPLPGEGAACANGQCEIGLRCVDAKCVKPGVEGAACKTDLECFGACVDGKCEKRCRTATVIPVTPPTSSASPSGSAPTPSAKPAASTHPSAKPPPNK